MNIKSIDKNTVSISTVNEIGLCYFDPYSERLVEFDPETSVHLTPFEHSVRRYYLVRTVDVIGQIVPTYAEFTVLSNNVDVEVKIKAGSTETPSKYDYYNDSINGKAIVFFNEFASNIIPVDLYLRSNTNREINAEFDIKIQIK